MGKHKKLRNKGNSYEGELESADLTVLLDGVETRLALLILGVELYRSTLIKSLNAHEANGDDVPLAVSDLKDEKIQGIGENYNKVMEYYKLLKEGIVKLNKIKF